MGRLLILLETCDYSGKEDRSQKKNPLSSRDAYLFPYATLESTLIVCARSFPKIYPSRELIQLLTTSPAFSPVITIFPPTDYSPLHCLLSNCH